MAWHWGPSFACLLVATLLKPVDVVCHAILPTPETRHPRYPFDDDAEAGGGAATAAPTAAPTAAGGDDSSSSAMAKI